MELLNIDGKRGLLVGDTAGAGILFAAVRFMNLAKQAIKEKGQFCVALSGGSTPKALYETLLKPEFATQIEWNKVKLFWSDERCVPPDSPESNYGMAMQYFSEPPLDQAKAFRLQGESDNLEKAALDYERTIKKECTDGVLDLILLGMGADGHTASLFPGTEALKVVDRLVVSNYVPEKNVWRLTFTFDCLNECRRMMLLTFGKDKKKVFQEVLQGQYPAGKLGRGSAPILFIVDKDCAR